MGCAASYSPILLAACFMALVHARFLAGNILNPSNLQGTFLPMALAQWVVNFLIMLPLIPMQNTMNNMSGLGDQLVHERGKLTKANYVWIVLFVLQVLIALLWASGALPNPPAGG